MMDEKEKKILKDIASLLTAAKYDNVRTGELGVSIAISEYLNEKLNPKADDKK